MAQRGFFAPLDLSVTIRSARPYLERLGLFSAYRNPLPRQSPQALGVHTFPLAEPLPLYPLQYRLNGQPPPDAGRATAWPSSSS